MNDSLYYWKIFYAILFGFVIILSFPNIFSDKENPFVKEIISHEFVSILGIVIALVFQSIINSAFRLKEIELKYKTKFIQTRKRLKLCIIIILLSFVAVFSIILIKIPLFSASLHPYINGMCFLIFFYMLSVTWDAIDLALSIEED